MSNDFIHTILSKKNHSQSILFCVVTFTLTITSCSKTPSSVTNTEDVEQTKAASTSTHSDAQIMPPDKNNIPATYTSYTVGDTVLFGNYYQESAQNKEPIHWHILEIDSINHKMLLLSEYVLDVQPYHKTDRQITWENCSLRIWLNTIFLTTAFTETEQAKIQTTHLNNPDNPFQLNGTAGGKETDDKIFLLSLSDVYGENSHYSGGTWYFNNNTDRMVIATMYAVSRGIYAYNFDTFKRCSNTNYQHNKCFSFWWLRSSGDYANLASCVQYGGFVYYRGEYVNNNIIGVRPAMWVKY